MSHTFYFNEIFNTVIKNKEIFELKSDLFWNNSIQPLWIENNKKKIGIHENKIYFYDKQNSNKWEDNFTGIALYSDLVFNYLSKDSFEDQDFELVKMSFLWFVGTNLLSADKYFNRNSIKTNQCFESGLRFIENLSNDDLEFKKYTITGRWLYGESLLEWGFFEANLKMNSWQTNRYIKNKENLKEKMKFKDFDEILSKGFFLWVAKNRQEEIKLPDEIKNQFHFKVWQKIVGSKPVTEKRLNTILEECKLGEYRFLAFNFLCNIQGLKEKKFFINIVSEINFGTSNSRIVKMDKNHLINKFIAKIKISNRCSWTTNTWVATFLERVIPDEADTEFFLWAKKTGAIEQTGIFNSELNENSYFSEDRYWENLAKIYNL
jgi:hypothetical protein